MTFKQYMAEEKAERERKDAESEARKKAHAEHIAALKAKLACVEERIIAREKKAGINALKASRLDRDTLTFLPSYNGNDYAQAEVNGELLKYDLRETYEAVVKRMDILRKVDMPSFYLDLDHDYASKLYLVDRVYHIPCAGLFCEGRWSAEGMRFKKLFIGVSPSLPHSSKFPPPENWVMAKKQEQAEREKDLQPVDSDVCLGAICINSLPTFHYDTPASLEAIGFAAIKAANSNKSNNNAITVTTWSSTQ